MTNESPEEKKKPFVFNFDEFRFSVSSLQSFRQCGKKFEFSKVLKVESEKEASHHRWFGRLVHNAIYECVADFQTEGESKQWVLRPTDNRYQPARVRDLFNAFWSEEIPETPHGEYLKSIQTKEIGQKPLVFSKQKKKVSMNTDNQAILNQEWFEVGKYMVNSGVTLLRDFVDEIDILEYKLEFEFEGKAFLGYIDVLRKDKDGIYSFYDFKTSWVKHNEKKIIEEAQIPLYSYGLKKILGLDYYPKGYIVHLRSGEEIGVNINAGTIAVEQKRFRLDKRMIQEGVFEKTYGPLCPYCDFFERCDPTPTRTRY